MHRIFWGKGVMQLGKLLVYPAGTTEACQYGAQFLKEAGVDLVDHPAPEVTHLLLDVPSFREDGALRDGGDLRYLLSTLPKTIAVIGGNLQHPALDGYTVTDLLKDPQYLAINAAITAECALQVAAPRMNTAFFDSPALVLGWGRIGKCLARLLKHMGCPVTVAARKEADRAMLHALGYPAVPISQIEKLLPKCRLVFNTVPELLLHREQTQPHTKCLFVDLASRPGMQGEHVLWARGLPGIYAPESSGRLIARRFLQICKEGSP